MTSYIRWGVGVLFAVMLAFTPLGAEAAIQWQVANIGPFLDQGAVDEDSNVDSIKWTTNVLGSPAVITARTETSPYSRLESSFRLDLQWYTSGTLLVRVAELYNPTGDYLFQAGVGFPNISQSRLSLDYTATISTGIDGLLGPTGILYTLRTPSPITSGSYFDQMVITAPSTPYYMVHEYNFAMTAGAVNAPPLVFDVFFGFSQVAPEPATLVSWGLLSLIGTGAFPFWRRRRKAADVA